MRYQYKTISLKTVAGFTLAERLQARDWRPILAGVDNVTLEKPLEALKKARRQAQRLKIARTIKGIRRAPETRNQADALFSLCQLAGNYSKI